MMATAEELMKMSDEHLLYGNKLYKAVMDHGKGVYLYDTEGKEYLDLVSGIAVNSLGYGNQEFLDALKAQMDKFLHISAYYYNEPVCRAAKELAERAKMSKVFFCNSGTEAIEGSIKVAKKHALLKRQKNNQNLDDDYEVIAMHHSFHGRSMGSLGLTDNAVYQGPFVPGNVRAVFADFNDLEDVKSKITDKTCGIICEVLQGEGGLIEGSKEFFEGLRALCDEKDLILIFDEVQCGMGRLGVLFAHEHYGVMPDVMALAKAIGNGVPVGAFVMNQRCSGLLAPGEHGGTYGGNPLAATAVNTVLALYDKYDVLANVNKVAPLLKNRIQKMIENHPGAIEHRGMGLMQGVRVTVDLTELEKLAFSKGLLFCAAGKDVARFVPALVITEDEIEKAMDIFEECLSELE